MHFWKKKLCPCWRKDFKGLKSSKNHKMFLLLVNLGVVVYISVETSLGSCWRRDILRVKGQAFSQIAFFMTLSDMQTSSGNYSMRHQVPMVSLLLLVYVSAIAYISVEISLGFCWRRDTLRVKGQGLLTNCNFLWIGNHRVVITRCAIVYPRCLTFFDL